MRPVTLDVQGFTCFREAQPPLDLSGLSLFAITGPTGAGKSSLLDAITFALYGKVPRMGRGSVKELISHGCERMSVTLHFVVGDRAFVVARTARRGTGAGVCQLDEIVGGARQSVAAGATEVTAAIERVVGLDYDAFTQAVVLPQGEFARFLNGPPAQRRQILQELLRLTVYNRMQRLAGERSRDARRDVEALERQLGLLADAAPDAIERAEQERAAAEREHPARLAARDAARVLRIDVESRVQTARALAARRLDLRTLDEAHAEQAARLEAIARCRRARQVASAVEAVVRERERHASRLRACERADERLAAARKASTRAHAGLVAARQALADLEPSRTRIDVLRALEGRLQHRDALGDACRALAREVAALEGDATARAVEVQARQQTLADAVADLQRIEAALAMPVFDERELDACQRGRDVARELRSLRQQAPAVEATVREARTDARETARIEEAEAVAAREAGAALTRAEATRADAVKRVTEAQDLHRVMTLRSHLHAGDACPVCEQAVAVVPPVEMAPELAALFDAQDEAADACRTLSARVVAQQARHVRAAAAAEGARARLESATKARTELKARMQDSIARLTADLEPYLPASSAPIPEQWLLERLDDLLSQRARIDARRREQQIAGASRVDAEFRLALATQARESCEKDLAARRDRLAAQQAEYDRLQAEIRAVAGAADPREEVRTLSHALLDADGAVDAARVAVQRLDTDVAAATEAAVTAARERDETGAALDEVRTQAESMLAAHGFSSEGEVESAHLADDELAALEDAAEAHARRRAVLAAQVSDLADQVGGSPVTDAALAAAVTAEADAERVVDDGVRQMAQLDVRLAAMRERALEAAHVSRELHATRRTLDVHATLAGDLKADAFQAWLLREAFERLVAGASTRLMELSGRYTLQWIGDAFVVVDHDNALERRTADTLSGGETFLASLALALELSEQVQQAAGAVRLDSLFIDEGFGTLDATAQDVVAAAVESLQVRGRMVGIITHVRDLTDRMPACVVIDKRADGSRWSIR